MWRKLAIAGCRGLSKPAVQKSFGAVGPFPMNFKFLEWERKKHAPKQISEFALTNTSEVRRTIIHVKKAKAIVDHLKTSSKAWKDLAAYLKSANRAEDVIEECNPTKTQILKYVIED